MHTHAYTHRQTDFWWGRLWFCGTFFFFSQALEVLTKIGSESFDSSDVRVTQALNSILRANEMNCSPAQCILNHLLLRRDYGRSTAPTRWQHGYVVIFWSERNAFWLCISVSWHWPVCFLWCDKSLLVGCQITQRSLSYIWLRPYGRGKTFFWGGNLLGLTCSRAEKLSPPGYAFHAWVVPFSVWLLWRSRRKNTRHVQRKRFWWRT